MPGAYQAIVIGAGHNGLTCACYLARAGLKVLVLERYETYGGTKVSEQLAAPGFPSDVHASGYLVAKLTPAPDELVLSRHGLELITRDPNWAQVFPDGRAFTISRDVEETARSMEQFSRADADAWRGLYQRYLAAKTEIVTGMTSTPPPLAAAFAGKDAVDSYRFQFQSARSWIEENFQSTKMRYFFASCGLHGALAPDDALGANFAWLFAAAVQDVGVSIVKGGIHNVSRALAENDLTRRLGEEEWRNITALARPLWPGSLLSCNTTSPSPNQVLRSSKRPFLTNILVALALTLPWLAPQSRVGRFFDRPSVRTAILAYIIIVAVIYHYLLAKLWNPQGWELVADTIEHVVTPALYVIDWVLFVPKGTVRWKSAVVWLGYPLVYAVYSLIHGAVTGSYPYPFINVSNLGYDKVLTNMAVLVFVFLGLGVALIGIDRRMGRGNEQAAGMAT